MITSEQLSLELTERFGLPLNSSLEQVYEGQKITLTPAGIDHIVAFSINFILGWRSVTATFELGPYAKDLVISIKNANKDQKAIFSFYADEMQSHEADIKILLDNQSYPANRMETWPDNWERFRITMKRFGIVIETGTSYDYTEVFPLITGFTGLCLALLPLEEEKTGEVEGNVSEIKSNRYERSSMNRAACIQVHGAICAICGFDFGNIYGDFGKGFIEVHHIIPVSQMGEAYRLNPQEDLIPVCSNCHSMIHHRNPPLSLDELKDLIPKNGHCR